MNKQNALALVKTLNLMPEHETELLVQIEQAGLTEEIKTKLQDVLSKKIDLISGERAIIKEVIQAEEEAKADATKVVEEARQAMLMIEREAEEELKS